MPYIYHILTMEWSRVSMPETDLDFEARLFVRVFVLRIIMSCVVNYFLGNAGQSL